MITQIARATGFDWMTRAFKVGVTGFFAPFHARNFVSGIVQNYEVHGIAALNPKNIAIGEELTKKLMKGDLTGEVTLGGTKFSVKNILNRVQKRFGYSSQYFSDIGWDRQTGKFLTKDPVLGKFNPVVMARAVGNHIEMQQKITATIIGIKKGYNMDEALKLAEKAGFDYSRLSPFEKNVMRRLIPFYSFGRKNLELQLSTMAKNPQRIGNITKAGRALGSPTGLGEGEEELKYPDWMLNRFVADFGENQYGLPQVVSGFGTPIEEQAELYERGLMGILSRLNPLIKVPLEKATGRDFFYERDLSTVYKADEYQSLPGALKTWLDITPVEVDIYRAGEKTGETRIEYRADADRLHYVRNLFTSRGFNYIHTLFGEEELTKKGRAVRLLTGLKTYEIDEEEAKFFEDRDTMREYRDILKKLGIVKTFESIYESK